MKFVDRPMGTYGGRINQPVGEHRPKVYGGDIFGAPHGGARAPRRESDESVLSLRNDDVKFILVTYRVVEVGGDGQVDVLPREGRTNGRRFKMHTSRERER